MDTRTCSYKVNYNILIPGLVVCVWAMFYFHLSFHQGVALLLPLAIPEILLDIFWRDMFSGTKFLRQEQYEASIRHNVAFIQQIQRRPALKKLKCFARGHFTRDPEAFVLNNIGCATMRLRRLEEARRCFEAAITIENQNPFPFYNLGIISLCAEKYDDALKYFTDAKARGFSDSFTQNLITVTQEEIDKSAFSTGS